MTSRRSPDAGTREPSRSLVGIAGMVPTDGQPYDLSGVGGVIRGRGQLQRSTGVRDRDRQLGTSTQRLMVAVELPSELSGSGSNDASSSSMRVVHSGESPLKVQGSIVLLYGWVLLSAVRSLKQKR